MDIEDRLKQMQSLYSNAASAALAAYDRYLYLIAMDSSAAEIARAQFAWRQFESRKTAIVARMVELDELEGEVV